MINFVYLACPHFHSDPRVKDQRHQMVNKVSGLLQFLGMRVFSPISHTHLVDIALKEDGREIDHKGWLEADKPFMILAEALVVCQFPGWQDQAEQQTAALLRLARVL